MRTRPLARAAFGAVVLLSLVAQPAHPQADTPTAGRWTLVPAAGALRLELFWDDGTNTLRALGVRGAERLSDHSSKNLAWGGVGAASVRGFAALGLPLEADDLVSAAIRFVTPEYVRALRDAGARDIATLDDAADLRFVGVSPALVRRAKAAGGDLSPRGLMDFNEGMPRRRDGRIQE